MSILSIMRGALSSAAPFKVGDHLLCQIRGRPERPWSREMEFDCVVTWVGREHGKWVVSTKLFAPYDQDGEVIADFTLGEA